MKLLANFGRGDFLFANGEEKSCLSLSLCLALSSSSLPSALARLPSPHPLFATPLRRSCFSHPHYINIRGEMPDTFMHCAQDTHFPGRVGQAQNSAVPPALRAHGSQSLHEPTPPPPPQPSQKSKDRTPLASFLSGSRWPKVASATPFTFRFLPQAVSLMSFQPPVKLFGGAEEFCRAKNAPEPAAREDPDADRRRPTISVHPVGSFPLRASAAESHEPRGAAARPATRTPSGFGRTPAVGAWTPASERF